MLIAIATNPESLEVEHFTPDYPVLLHDVEDSEVKGTKEITVRDGCCATLARAVAGADVLICTGVRPAAARHLRDQGVPVALVPEGVQSATAIAAWLTQTAANCPTGKLERTASSLEGRYGRAPANDDSRRHCHDGGKAKLYN